MLMWLLIGLGVVITAGALGFIGAAKAMGGITKIILYLFFVLLSAGLIHHFFNGFL